MDISKGLILKGTAAAAAVATTTTGAVYNEEIGDLLSSLISGEDAEEKEEASSSLEDPESEDAASVGGSLDRQSSDDVGTEGPDQTSSHKETVKEKTEKDSLGLPDGWEWPTEKGTPKTKDLTIEQLKTINFDGKGDGEISSTVAISLTIEKVDENGDFPKGFKFIFNPKNGNNEVTINGLSDSITLKKGMNLEFKIKENGDKWSLERAWNKTSLAEKVNLTCPKDENGSGECSFKTTGTTNIFDDSSSKLIGATLTLDKGKIKFEENQEGYNQGLKLIVSEDDITVSGGNNSEITKLKKYSTYEIKEQNHEGEKKWFLSRKTSAKQEINKKLSALGLPNTCKFDEGKNDTPKDCGELDGNALKKIKFEGFADGFSASINGTQKVKLKISKNSNNEKEIFPDGIKIAFENGKKVTFTGVGSGSSIEWKKGTNPEFKVNSSGKLERAWTVNKLAEKVGLTCVPSSGTNKGECEFKTDKPIKVYEEESKKTINAKVSDTNKKLEYSENEENHNQGFKFIVKGKGNISLTSGDGIDSLVKNNTSYEIKYQGDGWYLSKKTNTAATS